MCSECSSSGSNKSRTLHKIPTIHQLTTMLAISKNVLFPGHNHHANHWYLLPDTLIIIRTPGISTGG